jgi:hypothetical protein
MPKEPTPVRTIKYSNASQVQGKGSNKTMQYLQGMDSQDPGQQGFYREALTDIPHPLEAGKTVTYGGLQDLLRGPQKAAALDAYARLNRMDRTPTAEVYQAAAFEAAKQRMMQRGAANPGELAFPMSADAARRAPNTAMAIAHGNYAQPTGGAVVDAASQAQRYADQPMQATYTAPGMPMKLVRGVAPAPQARIIPGTIVSR